jgi:hypothetical protein
LSDSVLRLSTTRAIYSTIVGKRRGLRANVGISRRGNGGGMANIARDRSKQVYDLALVDVACVIALVATMILTAA